MTEPSPEPPLWAGLNHDDTEAEAHLPGGGASSDVVGARLAKNLPLHEVDALGGLQCDDEQRGAVPRRAPFNVADQEPLRIDPNRCHPDPAAVSAYADGDGSLAHRHRWGLDEAFLDSIRFWNGNFRPAFVRRREPSGPRPVYDVLSGHRRWAACLELGLELAAVEVPPDLPETEVRRLVMEDNTTGRHRDEIVRTREAMASIPRIREELAARKRLGRGVKLEEGEATTVTKELARLFFSDLGRGHDHVRKLLTIVQTADGIGRLIDEAPRFLRGGYDGEGLSPEQQKLRGLAARLLDDLRPSPDGVKKPTLSVRAAHEQLETRFHDLCGTQTPGDTRDEVAARNARRRLTDQVEFDLHAIASLLDTIKPYALMTQADKDDLLRGVTYREWSYWGRRWPKVMRLFLDVTCLMESARFHSRKRGVALDLARAGGDYTTGQLAQLSAMFHQMGELFLVSPSPDWWREIDVIWPPMEPTDAEWHGTGLQLAPAPTSAPQPAGVQMPQLPRIEPTSNRMAAAQYLRDRSLVRDGGQRDL